MRNFNSFKKMLVFNRLTSRKKKRNCGNVLETWPLGAVEYIFANFG